MKSKLNISTSYILDEVSKGIECLDKKLPEELSNSDIRCGMIQDMHNDVAVAVHVVEALMDNNTTKDHIDSAIKSVISRLERAIRHNYKVGLANDKLSKVTSHSAAPIYKIVKTKYK